MTKHPECNVLQWLDPNFALVMSSDCAEHDDAYHNRTGRLKADWKWTKAAWKVSPWRAVLYGTALFAGGWFLYYDLDELVK